MNFVLQQNARTLALHLSNTTHRIGWLQALLHFDDQPEDLQAERPCRECMQYLASLAQSGWLLRKFDEAPEDDPE